MARRLKRGDIYFHRFGAPDKRRPVVILSRQEAIDVLNEVMVAPITTTVRGLMSEVVLDVEQGMKNRCAVNLDHVQTVRKSDIKRHITTLTPAFMADICRALSVATGCEPGLID